MIGAFVCGCSGVQLTAGEKGFLRDSQPWGLIVFRRNIDNPDQLRALIGEFREIVGRRNAPVLVDQEGGRVQRMGPPSNYWRKYPAARRFGEIFAADPVKGVRLTRTLARLMAADLHEVGINVDCLPVLDVPQPDGHDVIGDRAYAGLPADVSILARQTMIGMLNGGVLPVIKHIPGHGRATADSHLGLPVVNASRAELEAVDFPPFAALADAPIAMTAHVIYSAIDPAAPATHSPPVIEVIRKTIGFDGLLMTDDLSMKALTGDMADRVLRAREAGCDMMLHCNGIMSEMTAVAVASGELRGRADSRARAALRQLRRPQKFDRNRAVADLAELQLVPA
ncbi:MAG: beta-N-acetylhexosaminidase [Pseudomonadota bacterium]|nr:beta-N-acetylhexosaminidase [Pseudomonadota bacterium]